MIEKIVDHHGVVLCHIIRSEYSPPKTEFFTPAEYSQQVGIIKYPEGGMIKPHYHNKLLRNVFYTQEVLVIRKGKVKVNLYSSRSMDFVTSTILNEGDTILLATGGHGFEMIENTEMLEIKQGPYGGIENDKTHLEKA
ncbi:MAG: hypothetical protein ACHQET_01740 [Chitinophagales bacterium]